ncbi:DUF6318 family protein [Isoptericola sp. 4D.3]|uniref:DUF6318 family protein n=1 Tax=Isoptericola peretonis TaxID=2918523 RepID=A0ABT0J4J9_9MICO|nr:DUF6318 family protein [Isoptericola sp. 4D.3]
MTRNRAILAATSIAAAALLVAGCEGDTPATPSAEPTASASADASPSPSPSSTAVVVAPERPDAMDDDGPAGAEAAAVYFLELDPYIMQTGDTAEWETMSLKSCEYCANRLDQANEIADRDDAFSGGETNVVVLHTYEQDASTGIWPIDVRVREGASTIKDSNGEVLFTSLDKSGELRMEMAKRDGAWVVVGVADVPE